MRLSRRAVQPLIQSALREDGASRDVTSRAVLPAGTRIRARVLAKAAGVLAGGSVAAWTFQTLDPSIRCRIHVADGSPLRPGQVLLTVHGRARAIFAAERTALNLLGHLSGIATLTRAFVRAAGASRAAILDTRKTLPGLRLLEKHAVQAGGGRSHRASLAEAVLIKTNHLKALGLGAGGWGPGKAIHDAVAKAKRGNPGKFVEIEVRNLVEFKAALASDSDAILLDNWRLADIRRAVSLRNSAIRNLRHKASADPLRTRQAVWRAQSAILLEVSGGVTLANVRAIAKTGVDRISIGRLTHSAPSLDCSLRVV